LEAEALIASVLGIHIIAIFVLKYGGDFQILVVHHRLGRGGAPVITFRDSVLQLCKVEGRWFIMMTCATIAFFLHSQNLFPNSVTQCSISPIYEHGSCHVKRYFHCSDTYDLIILTFHLGSLTTVHSERLFHSNA
jgi:hypothetical protein